MISSWLLEPVTSSAVANDDLAFEEAVAYATSLGTRRA
jgi:hypothetical protein